MASTGLIKYKVNQWAKKTFGDVTGIDIDAYFDSTLTYEENVRILEKEFGSRPKADDANANGQMILRKLRRVKIYKLTNKWRLVFCPFCNEPQISNEKKIRELVFEHIGESHVVFG